MKNVSRMLTSLSICAALSTPVFAQSTPTELNKGTTGSATPAPSKSSKANLMKPKAAAPSNVANEGKTPSVPAKADTKSLSTPPHADHAAKPEVKAPAPTAAQDAKAQKLNKLAPKSPASDVQKTK